MGRYNQHEDRMQGKGGLSLEKFSNAKKSTYDKRQALERQKEEKLRQRSKYKKLKSKLEAAGKLTVGGFEVVDNGQSLCLTHSIRSVELPQLHASI